MAYSEGQYVTHRTNPHFWQVIRNLGQGWTELRRPVFGEEDRDFEFLTAYYTDIRPITMNEAVENGHLMPSYKALGTTL